MEEEEMDLSVLFEDLHIILDGWYTSCRYLYEEASFQDFVKESTRKSY
jgi:hypothetical protein